MAHYGHHSTGNRQGLDAIGPEVALWRAVIDQALKDATAYVNPNSNKGGSNTSHLDQRKARSWLLDNGEDFRTTCDCAQTEPEAVRRHARELAAKGWPQRRATLFTIE